jgi:hypothetical protein
MKKTISIALFFLSCPLFLLAQDTFRKYPVGESGCHAHFFGDPGQAELTYSLDSSGVYTLESSDEEGSVYSLILIDLLEPLEESDVEMMLTSYLDFLKGQFNVTSASGYGKGHALPTHRNLEGITDLWTTEEDEIDVCAYGERKFLAALLVFRAKGTSISERSAAFFKGFRFPGD